MAEALHVLQVWREFFSLWAVPDTLFKDTKAKKQTDKWANNVTHEFVKINIYNSLLLSYRIPQNFCWILQICLAGLSIRPMFKSFLSLKKSDFSFIWLKYIHITQRAATSYDKSDLIILLHGTEYSYRLPWNYFWSRYLFYHHSHLCLMRKKNYKLPTQRYWRLLNMGQKLTRFLSADQQHCSGCII